MKRTSTARLTCGCVLAGMALLLLGGAALAKAGRAELEQPWQAAFYMGGLSIGLWAIVLAYPNHWWAVFPGTMLAAGVGTLFLKPAGPHHVGGIVFLSLACAFMLCFLLGRPRPQVLWATYAAVVAALLGSLLLIDHAVLGTGVGSETSVQRYYLRHRR